MQRLRKKYIEEKYEALQKHHIEHRRKLITLKKKRILSAPQHNICFRISDLVIDSSLSSCARHNKDREQSIPAFNGDEDPRNTSVQPSE